MHMELPGGCPAAFARVQKKYRRIAVVRYHNQCIASIYTDTFERVNSMDGEEFIARVAQNRHRMMLTARSMLLERDCEDAVQSAILAAWAHLPQLRDECAFDAWLGRILINQCRQMQRGYQRERDVCRALMQNQKEEEESVLEDALGALNREERRLIQLHHECGYTIKEISDSTGLSEDVLKMRLYRARKRLKMVLISLLLLALLASTAVGSGWLDVEWFLKSRRAESNWKEAFVVPAGLEFIYTGGLLDFSVSDAVWNLQDLSVAFVYSITGSNDNAAMICSENLGVDGVRHDHVWMDGEILPVSEWAQGRQVFVYSVDGWQLGGRMASVAEDELPDGKGQTYLTEMRLEEIKPEAYERLLDEAGMLAFSAALTLRDYHSREILEEGTAAVCVSAPTKKEWREAYEAYHR